MCSWGRTRRPEETSRPRGRPGPEIEPLLSQSSGQRDRTFRTAASAAWAVKPITFGMMASAAAAGAAAGLRPRHRSDGCRERGDDGEWCISRRAGSCIPREEIGELTRLPHVIHDGGHRDSDSASVATRAERSRDVTSEPLEHFSLAMAPPDPDLSGQSGALHAGETIAPEVPHSHSRLPLGESHFVDRGAEWSYADARVANRGKTRRQEYSRVLYRRLRTGRDQRLTGGGICPRREGNARRRTDSTRNPAKRDDRTQDAEPNEERTTDQEPTLTTERPLVHLEGAFGQAQEQLDFLISWALNHPEEELHESGSMPSSLDERSV